MIAQLQNEVADLATSERIETGHRLVEEDDLGVIDERLRDADALHHALRELAQLQPPLGPDADTVERSGDTLLAIGGVVAEKLAEILEQFLGGQVVVEVGVFGKVADPLARRDVADRLAKNLGAPRRREDELHQQLQRGRLAGAVRSQKAEHLARLDRE